MTAAELFCFRCAEPMSRASNSELTCSQGEMGISRRMEQLLLNRFGARLIRDAAVPDSAATWYSPTCRSSLVDMRRVHCTETLADLLHQLVELHPHR